MINNQQIVIIKRATIFSLAIIFCLFFFTPVFAGDFSVGDKHVSIYVPGEILVKYKNSRINLDTSSGRKRALDFNSSKFLENIEELRKNNISVLKIEDDGTVEQKIAELKNDPNVEYAEPDYQRSIKAINTNDTYKNLLWGLDNNGQIVNGTAGTVDADIDAPEAWAINEGTNSTSTVAIIDTGVDYNHPDLAANMWNGSNCLDENGNYLGGCNHGYDFEDGDKTPLPTTSTHGTHVAGTIAAVKNNGRGIIGVAPHAKVMALKFGLDTFTEVESIDFAIQNGAKIINASYGGTDYSQAEYDAINRFKQAGGIFVAAAGNGSANNETAHSYPSDYDLDNIISVAATDQNNNLAGFSNYGAVSVDVGAPGTNILSTLAGSGEQYGYLQGTSMATPHVVGLAALIEGYNPNLTYAQVKSAILNTGDSLVALSGKTTSGKRINAQKALQSVNPAKAITSFNFISPAAVGVVDENTKTIYLTVPFGMEIASLTPTIIITGASVSPASSIAQDFSQPVTYTVTAADGSIQNYLVTVNVAVNPDIALVAADKAALTDDLIKGANHDLSNITAALTNPLPSFGVNSSTIAWNSSAPNIVSNDGQTVNRPAFADGNATISMTAMFTKGVATDTKEFILTVLKMPPSTIAIVTSSVYTVSATGTIINIPYGTGRAAFLSALTKGEVHQIWNDSGVSDPVVTGNVLTVIAQDGTTTISYLIETLLNPAKEITSFNFISPAATGVINETTHEISVSVPYGTAITSLSPNISITGASIKPASGVAQNFINPVVYTVTAADSSAQNYLVTVTVGTNSGGYSGGGGGGGIIFAYTTAPVIPFVSTPPKTATSTIVIPPTVNFLAATGSNNNPASSTLTTLIGAAGEMVNKVTADESQKLIANAGFVSLTAIEEIDYKKIIDLTVKTISDATKFAIADFIHYGTLTTLKLGSGERAGSISSFQSAFNRLPNSNLDWQDVVKIGNGRWTTQTSASAEARAKISFKQIYLREPNMANAKDNNAVNIMAYGLRPASRNTASEKTAILSFKYIFKKTPITAQDWDEVRAIAYSGAKR